MDSISLFSVTMLLAVCGLVWILLILVDSQAKGRARLEAEMRDKGYGGHLTWVYGKRGVLGLSEQRAEVGLLHLTEGLEVFPVAKILSVEHWEDGSVRGSAVGVVTDEGTAFSVSNARRITHGAYLRLLVDDLEEPMFDIEMPSVEAAQRWFGLIKVMIHRQTQARGVVRA